MIILLCILLFLWGCDQCCKADEFEYHEYEAERRHRERMEEERRHNEVMERKNAAAKRTSRNNTSAPTKVKRTRRILRDAKGRFIAAEEIIEEYE